MAGLGAPSNSLILPCIFLCFLFFAPGVFGFGAGNIGSISKVEGVNWRHGDIEDTLLTLMMSRSKKFSKLDVKRVYFGNWLRDYSQAVDVGTVKMVSAEAIRLLLWILGFLSFGYATKEFEVTRDRLGCYRPEEHIDNPKDYADNIDARQYDTRLRAPIDERRELAVDERTGMKNYIAAEDMGITTSAGMVRDIYRRCIELARRSRRSGNNDELYEAYRLLGTANHCLEDFSAHSNYTELCLIEMGERDIFPHVGRRTQIQVRGARDRIWPLITGTFGGVDFLHSVMGELSDKTVQNEITELEGTVSAAEQNRQSASVLKDILDKLPDGLFGGNNESEKVDQLQANTTAGQMQNMTISPKDPEEFTKQAELIRQQIYPVLEFHDEIMHGITETIEKIPILPDLLENLQEQVNVFVFSLIAPFILPVIKQVKAELSTGSSEVIQSSMDKQHVVFNDDNSTDPTHSMISKDHFTNVLNEPAGKVASQVLKWVVPQIVACWDDDRADVDRTINRIINGIFHHPALREQGDDGAREARQQMFHVVENWWREKSDRERDGLRDQLSRQGVEQGRNHKEGVHDSGHGCGKPLGMPNLGTSSSSGAIGGVLGAGLMGGLNQAMGGQQSGGYGGSGSGGRPRPQEQLSQGVGKAAGEAVGGGLLGNIVGGVVGGVGSSLLGGAFDEPTDEHKTYKQESHGQDGSYTQSYTETARRPQQGGYGSNEEKYGQAEYKRTDYPGGGRKEEYSRYEQDGRQGQSGSGYGFKQSVESKPTYDGGYERTEEKTYERPGGQRQTETRTEGISQSGDYYTSDKK
ncbi:Het-C-domain-containing protein [Tothia fuscella]|uniref:Het-C-domain-containing protein n=1 Tax=Tothia fuscella TaxID=1048955 RepID=A0A9P4TWN2_9PEZI|nr:Het-C-domain-containing protein [Tothia fuscella]